ncbi:unnamed protein product, partial [Discosporangium mesarthrocarpum]
NVKDAWKSFAEDFVAGGLAGAFSKTAIAPAERVKLLLQVQNDSTQISPAMRYKGPIDCVRRVYAEQGIMSFWRGNLVNVMRFIPSQALNFSLRDRFRNLFLKGVPIDAFWQYLGLSLLAGGASGGVSLVVLYPFDFARTRVGTDVGTGRKRQFRGSLDCLRQTFRRE